MSWPLSQDYNEAIQSPHLCFADPELRTGQAAVNPLGLPVPRSGNFADVYEVRCPASGRRWAVKCFTRAVPGLRDRYRRISAHLARTRLSLAVDFQYLEEGIRVRGQWYPVLKMDWVEGLLLNDFVREALDKPPLLEALAGRWVRLGRRLRRAGLAHGDLQHGNLLLVPGRDEKHLALKLIDYDGMFVPALAGQPSGEVGHPAYQHPQRLREGGYGLEVDRFPILLVAAALRALLVCGPALWQRYDNGDNLLFREADLSAPPASALFRELWQVPDAAVHALTGYLTLGCQARPEYVLLLEQLVTDDGVRPLNRAQEEAVAALLGPGARVACPPVPPARRTTTRDTEVDVVNPPAPPTARVPPAPAPRPAPPPVRLPPAPAPREVPVAILLPAVPAERRPVLPGPPATERRPAVYFWVAATLGLLSLLGIVALLVLVPEPGAFFSRPAPPSARSTRAALPSGPTPDPGGEPAGPEPVTPAVSPARPGPGSGREEKESGRAPVSETPKKDTKTPQKVDQPAVPPKPVAEEPHPPGEIRRFEGHTESVLSVAFTPDGRQLLSCGAEPSVRLWDVRSGKQVQINRDRRRLRVRVSPDGKRALFACSDGSLELWDLNDWRLLHTLKGHEGPATDVAFSADGLQALSCGEDCQLRLWDLTTGQEVCPPFGHEGDLAKVAGPPCGVALSLDGRRALVGYSKGYLSLWPMDRNELPKGFPKHFGRVPAVAFSRDGGRALSGGGDNKILLWDVGNGQSQDLVVFDGHTQEVENVAFSPREDRVLSGSKDGTMRLWDAGTGRELAHFDVHAEVTSVAFSPGGSWAVSAATNHSIRLWQLPPPPVSLGRQAGTVGEVWHKGLGGEVLRVAVSPDGRRALAACGDGTVRLWSLDEGREMHQYPGHKGPAKAVAFLPDGRQALTGGEDGTVRLWDLDGAAHSQELARLEEHGGGASSLAFSPDGKTLLVGTNQGAIRQWDVDNGKEGHPFAGHTGKVYAVAFSPDGRYVLSGGADRTVRLWSVEGAEELRRWKYDDEVLGVAFAPDGRRFVFRGKDQTVRLRDLATGHEEKLFEGHSVQVRDMAYCPDGAHLLAAAADGTLRLWRLPPTTLVFGNPLTITRDPALRRPPAPPEKPRAADPGPPEAGRHLETARELLDQADKAQRERMPDVAKEKRQKAREHLQTILDKYPRTKEAEEARERLDQLDR